MSSRLLHVIFALAAGISLCSMTAPAAFTQIKAAAEPQETKVALIELSPPKYPGSARYANITGDVVIELTIRPDGGIESAALFRGSPMLSPAALDSAKQSRFECHGCDGPTDYYLTYTFAIAGECHNNPDCSPVEERPPIVLQSPGHVTITVDPSCTCDPTGTITCLRRRSAKCLYLWRCSTRVIDSQ
jgi:TonB family protein